MQSGPGPGDVDDDMLGQEQNHFVKDEDDAFDKETTDSVPGMGPEYGQSVQFHRLFGVP